ncbi:EAL domain-containing protein [Blautia schinkii]|nr:EAL domain-containing protein [Blautia schinkii]
MQLITEYLALLIIVILTVFFYEKKSIPTPWVFLYRWCLILPVLSMLVDIICVSIEDISFVPYWLHVFLNSLYFLLCILTCSVMALFLFYKILEHVYDKHCLTRAKTVVTTLTAIYVIFLLANIRTGWIFWIDAGGGYHRGSLNVLGYFIMLAEGFFIILCYCKNRSSVGKMVSRALNMTVMMAVFMAVFQLMNREFLLNGTLMAYTDMIFFIHFQSQRIGYDIMTGLGNRKLFAEEISLRVNSGQQFQIVLLSLRNMDRINKQYSPRIGDELLYSVGHALEKFGEEVSAFRISGVSFALFCRYWSAEKAEKNLQDICEIIDNRWNFHNRTIEVEYLCGDLIHTDQNWRSSDVEEFVEYMLWYMKSEKVKRLRFNETVEHKVRYRNEMVNLLRRSIENKSFQVWYQPVYDLKTGSFSSAEALVRMWDENGKMISPGEFIPLAEDIGVVDQINWIVMEKVCSFWKEHAQLPLNSISVNMSMPQFADEKLPERLGRLMDEYGVPRCRLRLEMTERLTHSDRKQIQDMMQEMAKQGLAFYLDDFGIGYSNFISALQLPYECIKLDKSLMDGFSGDEHNCRIVRAVTDAFHDIGLQVIAEGIETEEQMCIAKEMGMDKIQGFYFAKPMPGEKLVEFLKLPVRQAAETGSCS